MAEAAGDVESGGGGGDGDEAGVPIAAAPAPPVSSTVTTAVGGFANDLRRRGDAQDPCAARPLCSVAECDTTEGDAALSEASELATVAGAAVAAAAQVSTPVGRGNELSYDCGGQPAHGCQLDPAGYIDAMGCTGGDAA